MSDVSHKNYPILPLRNSVLFPGGILPILIKRAQSREVIRHLENQEEQGELPEVVLLSQIDAVIAKPGENELYGVGTLARILKILHENDDSVTAIIEGVSRVSLVEIKEDAPYLEGSFMVLEDINNDDEDPVTSALFQSLLNMSIQIVRESVEIPKETEKVIQEIQNPGALCDFIASNLDSDVSSLQDLLETLDVQERLTKLTRLIGEQAVNAEVSARMKEGMASQMELMQRERYLQQQLNEIKRQMGRGVGGDGDGDELDEIDHRINISHLPAGVEKEARKQLKRLGKLQSSSSEYSITLNYVETLLDVPWTVRTDDMYDIEAAGAILEADHYGLEKVKKRLLEFLAVKQLNPGLKSPILCLVGPPGTGKTSISKSIARALGRKFQRIALGGVRDESEIRGHRRTYVGAMPGRLVRALTHASTNNPVILLDEIDKIGQDFRGTPEDAFLEVLDPAQNHTFSDHYLGLPLDLSNVLFIATANQLDAISAPLRDRMEIVEIPSYTLHEKIHIAQNHLVPKQIKAHGLKPENITIPDETLEALISSYTREAGVRGLERRVADICRRVATEMARLDVRLRDDFHKEVDQKYLIDVLGPEKYRSEVASRVVLPGIATGLAWTQAGGDILFVEASKMPGTGKLKLTGRLGDVMKESVEAALTYLRANAGDYDISANFMEDTDIHVHFPSGAVPKDGPSAGITTFSALLSVLTNKAVKNDVAMTGEISLRGQILAVGGIREKVIAAHRAGIKHVILPKDCERDMVEISPEVLEEIEIHFVEYVHEIPDLIF